MIRTGILLAIASAVLFGASTPFAKLLLRIPTKPAMASD